MSTKIPITRDNITEALCDPGVTAEPDFDLTEARRQRERRQQMVAEIAVIVFAVTLWGSAIAWAWR